VLKDGKPFMAIGTTGSNGIWQSLVQVNGNIINFHMDVKRAVTEPRMKDGGHAEFGSEIRPVFDVEDRIPGETMDSLRKSGYEVRSVKDDYGRVHVIVIDPQTNFRLGGADPRESGYAVGW
jgi:gamma-glutamyltranspeptidase/glutathione hydrolase